MHFTATLPGIWDLEGRQELPQPGQAGSTLGLGKRTSSSAPAPLQSPALAIGPLRGRTHFQKGRRIRRVPILPEDGPSQPLTNQKACFITASGYPRLELLFPELSSRVGAGGGND